MQLFVPASVTTSNERERTKREEQTKKAVNGKCEREPRTEETK